MKLLVEKSFDDSIAIFWDTDALNRAYKNPELLTLLNDCLKGKLRILLTPICMEFYNSEKGMENLISKRTFLNDNKTFFEKIIPSDTKRIQKVENKLLELKKIYAGLTLCGNPSYQDLLLQAYAVLLGEKVMILSGNIKDMNSSIFQIEGIVDFEIDKKNSERVFLYFMSINKEGYNKLVEEYNTEEGASIERMKQKQASKT